MKGYRKFGFAIGVLVASVSLATGCSDDSDGNDGSAGAGATSSAGVSHELCLDYCEHYGDSCSAQACAEYCDLSVAVVPEECADVFDAYLGCAATAELDCSLELGETPVGCNRSAVVACIGGPSCSRFTSADTLCEDQHPGLVGYICMAEADAGCVALDQDSDSKTRCCPE
ncbi:MAG TPA: hypothetical protein VM686_05880 [Polyangiaceae bacterium]|nr:hypothetical protein [Polyangiaceae bacterium]